MPRNVFIHTCDALLFDMDGTILTSRAAAERVWTRWARRHGLDVAAFLPTIHGRRGVDTVRDSGVAGVDPEVEAAAILAAEINDVAGIEPLPGAAEFLAGLPPERWAVVTSAPRRLAERRLLAAGLPLPEVLIAGDEVARGKPAPDAFLQGARRLGYRISDCLVFEDAPAGFQAAKAAGAPHVRVTAAPAMPAGNGAPRIDSYRSVRVKILDNRKLEVQIHAAGEP